MPRTIYQKETREKSDDANQWAERREWKKKMHERESDEDNVSNSLVLVRISRMSEAYICLFCSLAILAW